MKTVKIEPFLNICTENNPNIFFFILLQIWQICKKQAQEILNFNQGQ